MNGSFVREYQAEVTRGVIVVSLREGRQLSLEKGQEITIVEDSYGNTYTDGIFVNPRYFQEEVNANG